MWSRAQARRELAARLLHGSIRVISIIVLPFAVLVRGSVSLYQGLGFPSWLALGVAAGIALGILTLYGVRISRKFSGIPRAGVIARWIALPVVICYCGYALVFLGRDNVKTDAVRATYLATHPLLRVALTTVILLDRDLVITDLARTREDYVRMGLSVREESMHYPQADGWVHAVDIRTTGRGALSNAAVWLYFRAMGFDTLRHRGTADHLHVALSR